MRWNKTLKMTALLMGLMLALTGCNAKETSVNVHEDPNKVPKTPYNINWYLNSPHQADVGSVELAINEYLKDKINATVKINFLEGDQYSKKMTTMIAAGAYFDLAFCARWMLSYIENARAGAFVSLNGYMDTYFKDFMKEYPPAVIEASKVDGELYALPVHKEQAQQYGWIYRKDIAEKYGIDMSQYKSFEDLEPLLEMIKKNEPDIQYPIEWNTSSSPASLLEYLPENRVFRNGLYPDTQVINLFETPEYEKACETAYRFYNKGLIRKDILTATDMNQRMNDGRTFAILYLLKPGKAEELFGTSAFPFEQVTITEPMFDYLPGTGSMQCISSTSKNPDRVARFLNLLNTDPYLKNLVIHGIEGKHYKKVSEGVVEPIPNSGYSIYSRTWAIGNVFIDYTTPSDPPGKLEGFKALNDSAKDLVCNYFMLPANDEIELLKRETNNAASQYKKLCELGAMDYKQVKEELLSKLKTAGFDKVLEYTDEEFKKYRESKGYER